MRTQFGSIDFIAVPGDEVRDHETISFQDSEFNLVDFENVVGRDVVFPAGNRLDNGDSFSVTGPQAYFTVRFVSGALTAPGDVRFNIGMTAIDVAEAVMAVLPGWLNPHDNGDGSISLYAASDVTVIADIPVGQSNPVQVRSDRQAERVHSGPAFLYSRDTAGNPDDRAFGRESVAGRDGNHRRPDHHTTLTYVTVGTGNPGEVVFSPLDSADVIAARVIAQLPAELGAVYEGNGVITFINDSDDRRNAVGIEHRDRQFVRVDEGRVTIRPANGDNLIDGETLTFIVRDRHHGCHVYRFTAARRARASSGSRPATRWPAIARRLLDALPIELSGRSSATTATPVRAIASSVTSDVPGTNIDLGPAPSRRIAVPDGFDLINGEMLTI